MECKVCGTSGNVQRCSACHSVFYCNKDHQNQDWKSHKHDCAKFKQAIKEGVVREVIAEGNGESPKVGSQVHVSYSGKFGNGKEFDASEGFNFALGKREVIKGWDVGVAQMSKGEKAKLYIDSSYAYGDSGAPPVIPGDCPLVFDVELKDFR